MSYLSDLKEFRKFLEEYKYDMPEVEYKDNIMFCGNEIIKKDGKFVIESDSWLNVTSASSNPYSKMLSNLFHYEFVYNHLKFNSLEGFFQGIKFIDKKIQKEVFKYSGLEALVIKCATSYNWKETGIVYFQGKPIDRFSKEYDDLTIKLYVSAIQNNLYRNALINSPKPIVHVIGDEKKEDSVFTRYEFEYMLNALRDYLKENEISKIKMLK